MRFRTVALLLTLVLLLGPLAAGIASSETRVGSDLNVRTVVALKVAEAEAQRLLPAGWQVNPAASGPSQGANLSLVFIDELLAQDPEGKAQTNSVRRLAVVVSAKNPTAGPTRTSSGSTGSTRAATSSVACRQESTA